MKRILILLFIPGLLFSQEYKTDSPELAWHTDYNQALAISKKKNKNLLVYFTGSDWCAPCKKLKEDLFVDAEFKTLSANYILVYVDLPRNKDLISAEQYAQNKALLPKLNRKGVFPFFVVVDPKEKLLDDLSGYSMNGDITYHLELLKKNRS